eukprot:SAG31_NODE_240_length_19407_cov_29.686140_12_plen_128_part_00
MNARRCMNVAGLPVNLAGAARGGGRRRVGLMHINMLLQLGAAHAGAGRGVGRALLRPAAASQQHRQTAIHTVTVTVAVAVAVTVMDIADSSIQATLIGPTRPAGRRRLPPSGKAVYTRALRTQWLSY